MFLSKLVRSAGSGASFAKVTPFTPFADSNDLKIRMNMAKVTVHILPCLASTGGFAG